MSPTHCVECSTELGSENRADGDSEAAFCQPCWDKRLPFSPKCPACGEELRQGLVDPHELQCSEHGVV